MTNTSPSLDGSGITPTSKSRLRQGPSNSAPGTVDYSLPAAGTPYLLTLTRYGDDVQGRQQRDAAFLSILGETALSFIGLGLKAPVVSWGVLLTSARNFRTVALSPWLLIPVLFVVATVMTFMFLGDGLRDAAGPYK